MGAKNCPSKATKKTFVKTFATPGNSIASKAYIGNPDLDFRFGKTVQASKTNFADPHVRSIFFGEKIYYRYF